MTGKYESDIQSDIFTLLKKWGWWAHKNKVATDGCPKGWPDISVYVPGGRLVLLEIKRPGKARSNTQKHVADLLMRVGFPVYVIDNLGHAVRVLNKEYETHGGIDGKRIQRREPDSRSAGRW